jgi:hypothetical protein
MPTLASAEDLASIFVPAIALIIQMLMMAFFLLLVTYPMNIVFKKEEIGFKETLLASPATAGDIFLGEFIGKLPIFASAVLLFAPIVVGLANPIINMSFVNYIVIYACVVGNALFAHLIGLIIASWLENKISKNEKARDLGKGLIWITTILFIVIMYALMFFFNELLVNPNLKNWLSFFPSIWYSNIILYSIDPLLLSSSILNIWLSCTMGLCIPAIVLYLSYRNAPKFYSLDSSLEKLNAPIKKRNNILFSVLKLIPNRWGGLVVFQLKRFFRKKANFGRIAYVFGLTGFLSWFLSRMGDDFLGLSLVTTVLIGLGGSMGSMMLGHLGFVDSKEIVWIYKKSPRGVKSLVYSYLMAMFVFNIAYSVFITILISIFLQFNIVGGLIFFVEFLVFSEISMCQASGIQCFSPSYGEKDSNMKGNAMLSMLLMQPILFLPIIMLILFDLHYLPNIQLIMHTIIFAYNIVTSLPVLHLGLKKLEKLE